MRDTIAVSILVLCWALASPAWAQSDLLQAARGLFQPIPTQPPALQGVERTPARVALGTMLYFEPRLSKSHNISCNTCHLLGLGGVDLMPTSIGHLWQHGARNAPTVLNAMFNTAQFWDGRAKDLAEQAGGPIHNPLEMGITEAHAVEQLKGIPGYVEAFTQAFPGEADPVTFANLRNAIALFESTLLTPNAPFDRYLQGDEQALTEAHKEGLRLFIDKGCAGCHNGINVGGGMYAPFGVVQKPGADILPLTDKGRFEVTKTVSDAYVFKVPTLRNIALTAPYFHSGQVWDLRQAVAIMGTSQLGSLLQEEDITKITTFLQALTGEQPQVVVPILPPSVATTPRPEP
jgi:cytochrome c peroxidase